MTRHSRDKSISPDKKMESKLQDPERRSFLGSSVGMAAVGAASVMGACKAFAAEVELPELVTEDWQTLQRGAQDTDLFTETTGWDKGTELTWWPGRNMAGVAIGIIRFQANLPMVPGNMGNASTFNYPVVYVEGNYPAIADIMAEQPTESFTNATVEACKWLELQGVRAITTNCGFYATYQKVVQDRIDVPFYSSSLMQLPMMVQATSSNKKVGVLTANGPLLSKGPALINTGLNPNDMDRVVIEGCEDGAEFKHNLLGLTGKLNPYKLEQDILAGAERLMKREPNIGSILLECTELAPSAKAVQDLTRVPVWDFTTLTDWMYTGAMRRRFTGYM
ncbi:MAG: hypothetical protein GQ538_08760 [Xanthomonadales bacterium]|nr:hypothetical protein [Xanthomonadales bacterium]